jgi:signal transduction histidine kinase
MSRGLASDKLLQPDADTVHFAEVLLAGAIGASSARVMVETVVQEEPLGIDEVLNILDETSQIMAYSHKLEQKSRELEAATAELRAANERLKELDRLKDDFISTVSHELRTPLTSIRALSEILFDEPELDRAQRTKFLGIIIKESERLTRLISQVLDLAKIEAGSADWHPAEIDLKELIEEAATAVGPVMVEQSVALRLDLPGSVPPVTADRDRLMQVMLNLISNAVKFCDKDAGRITIALTEQPDALRIDVTDNGPGIRRDDQDLIFEKFRQAGDTLTEKPQGTGLGLPISRQIVDHLGGRLWVESEPGKGAKFSFTVPRKRPDVDVSPQDAGDLKSAGVVP